MANRSKLEQETIITYNQDESLATCYTFDTKLMRKLDDFCSKSSSVQLVKQGDGWREYTFPKKWVRVNMSRVVSDEKRKELAERAKKNFGVGG